MEPTSLYLTTYLEAPGTAFHDKVAWLIAIDPKVILVGIPQVGEAVENTYGCE